MSLSKFGFFQQKKEQNNHCCFNLLQSLLEKNRIHQNYLEILYLKLYLGLQLKKFNDQLKKQRLFKFQYRLRQRKIKSRENLLRALKIAPKEPKQKLSFHKLA